MACHKLSFHKSCSRNLTYIHIVQYFLDNKKIAVVAKKRCRQLLQMSSKSGFPTNDKLYITCRLWLLLTRDERHWSIKWTNIAFMSHVGGASVFLYGSWNTQLLILYLILIFLNVPLCTTGRIPRYINWGTWSIQQHLSLLNSWRSFLIILRQKYAISQSKQCIGIQLWLLSSSVRLVW